MVDQTPPNDFPSRHVHSGNRDATLRWLRKTTEGVEEDPECCWEGDGQVVWLYAPESAYAAILSFAEDAEGHVVSVIIERCEDHPQARLQVANWIEGRMKQWEAT